MRRLLKRALLLAVALPCGYFTAALAGAVVPANPDFVSASESEGVPIWVTCNDIHSDVVVPAKNQVYDWSGFLKSKDQATLVAFGWGDRTIYLETPTWKDVKVRNVAGALCGMHNTAMHVAWESAAGNGPDCRALRVSTAHYRRLCSYIHASFVVDAEQRAVQIPGAAYWSNDAFYEAKGSYSAFHTCNTWTGGALDAAGVRVGVWTPMKWGVLWQL